MNPIRHKRTIAVMLGLGLAALILSEHTVRAQFVPGPYYYPDAGVMGLATSAYTSAAQQNAYTQNRQMQMTSSMAKSQAWQNVNRTMQMEASSRPASVPDSGQVARDWMYQNVGPSRPAGRSMTLPATDSAAVAKPQKPSKPAAQKEIMLWPTLLKQQRFDKDRAQVEAPFRRAYADGKPLTIEDYQGIISTLEKMKDQLKGMASELVDTEYASVDKFLDDLMADAQKRIKARE